MNKQNEFGVENREIGELFEQVEKQVQNGYIILIGDIKFLQETENAIYPPHTAANKHFELLMFQGITGISYFSLAKKTKKLEDKFGYSLSKMVAVEVFDSGIAGYKVLTVEYKGAARGFKEFAKRKVFDFVNLWGIFLEEGERPLSFFENHEDFISRFQKKKPKKSNKARRKSISKSIRHEVFKRDGFKCVECGATKEDIRLHIDHILPVSQDGSDELDNLQTLCETCNLAKSNRKWKGGV